MKIHKRILSLILITTFVALIAPPLAYAAVPNMPANVATSFVNSNNATDAGINVTWQDNATNESGYQIQSSIDGRNFSTIATVGVDKTAAFIGQNSLSPNTLYWFRVAAVGPVGELSSFATTNDGAYSPAHTPSLTVYSTQAGTISLSINTNGNPDYTTYVIRNLTNSSYLKSDGSTSAGENILQFYTATQWNGYVNNISQNTSYQFEVRARNQAGMLTSASAVTAPITPNGSTPTTQCPALSTGTMIRVEDHPAIYVLDKNNEVLYFPTGDEFKSWNSNENYAGYYTTVSQNCFDSLNVPSTYPAGVNFRPGSYLIKQDDNSNQLYVVLPGNSLSKITAGAAHTLYGNYQAKVISGVFWTNYINRGADITDNSLPEGTLIQSNGKIWYVGSGKTIHEVTDSSFTASRFKSAFVRTVSANTIGGYSVGSPLSDISTTLGDRTSN